MHSKLFTLCILSVGFSIMVMGLPKRSIYNSSAYGLQSQSARVIEHIDRARLEMGLFKAIKIIKEHDVDAENFPVGFKIEFKNTSNKPIYHLSAQAVIPQTGRGFKLLYGRGRLVDLDERLIEADTPVRPGETAFLTIPEKQDKVGDILRAQGSGDKLNKILIAWQCLNYGDGTGFITSEPEDRSNRKIRTQQSKRDLDGLIASLSLPRRLLCDTWKIKNEPAHVDDDQSTAGHSIGLRLASSSVVAQFHSKTSNVVLLRANSIRERAGLGLTR